MLFDSPRKQGEKSRRLKESHQNGEVPVINAQVPESTTYRDQSLGNQKASLKHIAIIMDGNGRWAQKRGFTRVVGHRNGINNVRKVVRASHSIGLKALTLFAFSEENWRRPKPEINMIMSLIDKFIVRDRDELNENNIQLRVIGDLGRLPAKTAKLIAETVEFLSHNDGMILNIALSYGGRSDIVSATKQIAAKVAAGEIDLADIDESLMTAHLSTAELPEPDLLIRTSGEQRLSNFLLWQFAYTELYFTDVFWPDFTEQDLFKAIEVFEQRERRFGAVIAKGAAAHSTLPKIDQPSLSH